MIPEDNIIGRKVLGYKILYGIVYVMASAYAGFPERSERSVS
jgi:hypothetical protein